MYAMVEKVEFITARRMGSVIRGLVWLARPSHLITGRLGLGRDGLAAVTISSHLFSTNQMLLAGIRANSIHRLRELSHAYISLMAMDFLQAGDRATRRGEGCSGIERPLARFELERTREQKKPYLAKRASWHRHSQSLSKRLTP